MGGVRPDLVHDFQNYTLGVFEQVSGFGLEHEPARSQFGSVDNVSGLLINRHIDNHQALLRQDLSFFQYAPPHIPDAFTVHENPADLHVTIGPHSFFIDTDNLAVFDNLNLIGGDSHLPGQARVEREVAVFPMDRNKILRPGQVDHQLQFFPKSMAGNMDIGNFFVHDVGAPAVQAVDDPGNGFFVARNEF